jgi:hypothetical protein
MADAATTPGPTAVAPGAPAHASGPTAIALGSLTAGEDRYEAHLRKQRDQANAFLETEASKWAEAEAVVKTEARSHEERSTAVGDDGLTAWQRLDVKIARLKNPEDPGHAAAIVFCVRQAIDSDTVDKRLAALRVERQAQVRLQAEATAAWRRDHRRRSAALEGAEPGFLAAVRRTVLDSSAWSTTRQVSRIGKLFDEDEDENEHIHTAVMLAEETDLEDIRQLSVQMKKREAAVGRLQTLGRLLKDRLAALTQHEEANRNVAAEVAKVRETPSRRLEYAVFAADEVDAKIRRALADLLPPPPTLPVAHVDARASLLARMATTARALQTRLASARILLETLFEAYDRMAKVLLKREIARCVDVSIVRLETERATLRGAETTSRGGTAENRLRAVGRAQAEGERWRADVEALQTQYTKAKAKAKAAALALKQHLSETRRRSSQAGESIAGRLAEIPYSPAIASQIKQVVTALEAGGPPLVHGVPQTVRTAHSSATDPGCGACLEKPPGPDGTAAQREARLRPYQRFFREFTDPMATDRRGIMVYHEPGAGKTCLIAAGVSRYLQRAMENPATPHTKVVVFVPDSRMFGETWATMRDECGSVELARMFTGSEPKPTASTAEEMALRLPDGRQFVVHLRVMYSRNVGNSALRKNSTETLYDLRHWVVFVDEAHNMLLPPDPSHTNVIAVSMLRASLLDHATSHGAKVFLMTGTPLKSSPSDLCLLNMVVSRDADGAFPTTATDTGATGAFWPLPDDFISSVPGPTAPLARWKALVENSTLGFARDNAASVRQHTGRVIHPKEGEGKTEAVERMRRGIAVRNAIFAVKYLKRASLTQDGDDESDDVDDDGGGDAGGARRRGEVAGKQAASGGGELGGEFSSNSTLDALGSQIGGLISYVSLVYDGARYPAIVKMGDVVMCWDQQKDVDTCGQRNLVSGPGADPNLTASSAAAQRARESERSAYEARNWALTRFDRVIVELSPAATVKYLCAARKVIYDRAKGKGAVPSPALWGTPAAFGDSKQPFYRLRPAWGNTVKGVSDGEQALFRAMWQVALHITAERCLRLPSAAAPTPCGAQQETASGLGAASGLPGAGLHYVFADFAPLANEKWPSARRDWLRFLKTRFGAAEVLQVPTFADFSHDELLEAIYGFTPEGASNSASRLKTLHGILGPPGKRARCLEIQLNVAETKDKSNAAARHALMSVANHDLNALGEYVCMIVAGKDGVEGLSVKNGVAAHILTPPGSYDKNQQISRRIMRLCGQKAQFQGHQQNANKSPSYEVFIQQYLEVPHLRTWFAGAGVSNTEEARRLYLNTLLQDALPGTAPGPEWANTAILPKKSCDNAVGQGKPVPAALPSAVFAHALLPKESLIAQTYEMMQNWAVDCEIMHDYHSTAAGPGGKSRIQCKGRGGASTADTPQHMRFVYGVEAEMDLVRLHDALGISKDSMAGLPGNGSNVSGLPPISPQNQMQVRALLQDVGPVQGAAALSEWGLTEPATQWARWLHAKRERVGQTHSADHLTDLEADARAALHQRALERTSNVATTAVLDMQRDFTTVAPAYAQAIAVASNPWLA